MAAESTGDSGGESWDAHLASQHRALVVGSGITPEVARERGYRTVGTKAELRRLGFSDAQCRVPALLVPIHGVGGEVVLYQIRSDEPRVVNGKALKYETPKGARMALDVPPRARPWLGDPKRSLFITEGARKGDAGVSAGLCTIALLGVWNFRGTNEHGGKLALPDWELVALNGRDVFIVFDSDVMTKRAVHAALLRLKAFLGQRGASVMVIYLPSGEGGTKVGLDDFLASGKTKDDLLALATTDLRRPAGEADEDVEPAYRATPNGLVWNKPTAEGPVEVLLTNFTARIKADIREDDGLEVRRSFEIESTREDETRCFTVPAESFGALNWVIAELGARAIVSPGFGLRDHARVAIQFLSPEAEERTVYTHVGWRDLSALGTCYLHAGGAIGAQGVVPGVEIDLAPPLDRYSLPAPPEGEDLVDAVRESLKLLDNLAPDRVMFPLFSMVWRGALETAPFSIHIVGSTGIRKTELAALVQRFFGDSMDAEHLPAHWSSTANYLEELAFRAKDAILTVDDFKPGGSVHDQNRLHLGADRLFRAQGNRSGRGRMRANGTIGPPHPPRGAIVSTGEDVPAGHSLVARVLVLELASGEVNLSNLTRRQQAGGSHSRALAGFVRWAACQRDRLRTELRSRVPEARDRLIPHLPHGRTATMGADLLVAFGIFLRFAREVGAIDTVEEARLLERGQRGILQALSAQSEHQASADATTVFRENVASALQAGRAHLADLRTGRVPEIGEEPAEAIAQLVGWKLVESEDDQGHVRREWRPGGDLIGWIDADSRDIYLLPKPALRVARDMARESPSGISLGERQLGRALEEKGFLVSKDPDGRRTKKVRAAGEYRNALHLRADALFGGAGATGTKGDSPSREATAADSLPLFVPDTQEIATATGTGNGNEAAIADLLGADTPATPVVPDRQDQRDGPSQEAREERAAILESEAGMTRGEAERQAGLYPDDGPDPEGH